MTNVGKNFSNFVAKKFNQARFLKPLYKTENAVAYAAAFFYLQVKAKDSDNKGASDKIIRQKMLYLLGEMLLTENVNNVKF